jgi:NAD(P)-dependent dehydrogenase (short-subunit alcohol dehydrogenase family)
VSGSAWARSVRGDVASLPVTDVLADRVKAELGTVDALFATAGMTSFSSFEAISEELDQILAVNAEGPYFTVQKLCRGRRALASGETASLNLPAPPAR